jgi:hypothetical protein
MNVRILFKSVRLAFRAKKRFLAFVLIYAILYIVVAKSPGDLFWLLMAFSVSTVYAILIAQFRKRDIAIFKCIGWANNEVILLVIGEVVIVALSAFLVVFQLSVEILGLAYYISGPGDPFLLDLYNFISVPITPMLTAVFIIVIMQIPGLIFAQWRATQIPPMRALREE